MIEKSKEELVALARLYHLMNGKYPEKPEDINLETLNIPEALAKYSELLIQYRNYVEIGHLISYLGKHIQDCYDS